MLREADWVLAVGLGRDVRPCLLVRHRLARAIAATFARRSTAIPTELPDALTDAFANDPAKQRQWDAFLRGIEAEPIGLTQIIDDLARFLMPQALAAASRT